LFLNPDRGHLPDIDSDFGPTRGSEVFEHLNNLYGKDHCCNIITFSNLQARAIIKDVCRSFEIPLSEVNAVTKFVPNDVHKFNELLEIKELKEFFDKYDRVYRHCEKLYGSPRHHSQHPAGICVLPFPVTDIMPVENATPTVNEMVGLMSQFEKENTELVGGVKLDILKLSNQEALYNQMDVLKKEYGLDMTLRDIPLDDDKTWDLICSCDTAGIFQMESDVGKGVIRQVKPRNMEELSAVNAFVRPGTSGLENYCEAKVDQTKIVKYHPIIDKILAPTYGGIIYQETIMSLIAKMMNISFGKADIYRRALEKPNKKGNVELVEEFKSECVPRAIENGISKEAAEKIQQAILDNAGYLFNKSHWQKCRVAR
jgi:DNA polymerase III, alpha subunit